LGEGGWGGRRARRYDEREREGRKEGDRGERTEITCFVPIIALRRCESGCGWRGRFVTVVTIPLNLAPCEVIRKRVGVRVGRLEGFPQRFPSGPVWRGLCGRKQ
jgi:hypothetical protein